jgi:hypothetical protein
MIKGVRAAGQYGKEGDVHAAERLTMERMAIHQKEFMAGHGYWEIIKDLCLLLRLSRVSKLRPGARGSLKSGSGFD